MEYKIIRDFRLKQDIIKYFSLLYKPTDYRNTNKFKIGKIVNVKDNTTGHNNIQIYLYCKPKNIHPIFHQTEEVPFPQNLGGLKIKWCITNSYYTRLQPMYHQWTTNNFIHESNPIKLYGEEYENLQKSVLYNILVTDSNPM